MQWSHKVGGNSMKYDVVSIRVNLSTNFTKRCRNRDLDAQSVREPYWVGDGRLRYRLTAQHWKRWAWPNGANTKSEGLLCPTTAAKAMVDAYSEDYLTISILACSFYSYWPLYIYRIVTNRGQGGIAGQTLVMPVEAYAWAVSPYIRAVIDWLRL